MPVSAASNQARTTTERYNNVTVQSSGLQANSTPPRAGTISGGGTAHLVNVNVSNNNQSRVGLNAGLTAVSGTASASVGRNGGNVSLNANLGARLVTASGSATVAVGRNTITASGSASLGLNYGVNVQIGRQGVSARLSVGPYSGSISVNGNTAASRRGSMVR
jgi:hypothetical protein